MNFNLSNINWKSQATWVLLLTSLLHFTCSFTANFITVLLPDISVDLDVPVDTLNWITLIFLIAIIAITIPASKNIKRFDLKKSIRILIFLLILGLVLSAITPNMEVFLFSRLIQGASIALIPTIDLVIIVLAMPEEDVGKALGIIGSAGYVGMTIAPSVTGFVSNFVSWRYAFLIIVPLLVFLFFLIRYIKVDNWVVEKNPIDFVGSIMYIFMTILFVLGISSFRMNNIFYLIGFFILLIIFIFYEKRIKNPIYNLDLLKNYEYLIGNFASMVNYFVAFITVYTLSFYLQLVLKLNNLDVGLLLFITPVIMIFGAPIAGKLSDKHDPTIISALAMILIAMALAIFTSITSLPFYMIIVAFVLQGIGQGLFSSPNNKNVLTSVSDKDLDDASALLTTIKEVGKMLSLSMFNLICIIFVGYDEIQEDILGLCQSMRLIMFISLVLVIICVLLLLISKFYLKKNKV